MDFEPYTRTELTGTLVGFASVDNRLLTRESRERHRRLEGRSGRLGSTEAGKIVKDVDWP